MSNWPEVTQNWLGETQDLKPRPQASVVFFFPSLFQFPSISFIQATDAYRALDQMKQPCLAELSSPSVGGPAALCDSVKSARAGDVEVTHHSDTAVLCGDGPVWKMNLDTEKVWDLVEL